MKVSEDVYVVRSGNGYLLYNPLQGSAATVNPAALSAIQRYSKEAPIQGELEKKLISMGILVEADTPPRRPVVKLPPFAPTQVSLFPTSDCNLRCIYCYGQGGQQRHVMRWEHAKAAIDLVVENALKTGVRNFSVNFHGGGEPTHGAAWTVLTRSVGYAKELAKSNGLTTTSALGTNGVLTNEKLEWITQNLESVNVSLDGTPELHDLQRPAASGTGSFESVMKSLRYFEDTLFPYDIRVTITAHNVDHMLSIARFIFSNTSRKSFAIEPVSVCGRCFESAVADVDPEKFLSNLIDCEQEFPWARIHYSAVKLNRPYFSFCGACGQNFCVTPQGFVTSCNEVTMLTDALASHFIFGNFNERTAKYDIDEGKLELLRRRTVDNLTYCRDCFAKYSCAGDCPARIARASGDMLDTSRNNRCQITRGLLLHRLGVQKREQL
jgi:uncharacterized protein